jgi:hypothetical protein
VVERAAATAIHQQWTEAGSPPCDHPKVSPEYDRGSPTGHQVCRRCGMQDPMPGLRSANEKPG